MGLGEKMKFKEAMDKVKTMYSDLQHISDEKLIVGYKNAMKDYKEKKDEKIKAAADVIKVEIDRRGLKI
jgi:hypothetical protein